MTSQEITSFTNDLVISGIISYQQAGFIEAYYSMKNGDVVNSIVEEKKRSVRDIISQYYNVSWEDILRKDRKHNLSEARHVYSFICRRQFRQPLNVIGAELKKDRTTVMHSCVVIENMIYTKDESVCGVLNIINKLLKTNHVEECNI